MASEPPWAILPPSHVSATLTANGEVIRIDDPGKKFYRLGRNEELVDIHIKSQTASRVHAIMAHHQDGGIYVYDLQSANGTFINGSRIPSRTETKIAPGSTLRFGEDGSPVYTLTSEDKRVGAKQGMLASLGDYGEEEEETEVQVSEPQQGGREGGRDEFGRESRRGERERSRERSRSRERGHRRDERGHDGRRNDGDWERGGRRRFSEEDGGQPPRRGGGNFSDRGPDGQTAAAHAHNPMGSGVSAVAQKRKLLWGNKGAEAPAQTGTWEKLSTGLGAGAQDRFMQLMGAKKHANEGREPAREAEMGVEEYRAMQMRLEKEHEEALRRTQVYGKRGLG